MKDIIDKVQKLLSRAEGNPFEAEAQTCILKAQKLMAEHHLSTADVSFIGLKEDVELSQQVFGYAVIAINFNAAEYMKQYKHSGKSTKGVKNTYIDGFLTGLKEQFAEQVACCGWGLVLVKDVAVENALNKLRLQKTSSSASLASNEQARSSGYRAGKSFIPASGSLQEGV
jgi:hypothetical protein